MSGENISVDKKANHAFLIALGIITLIGGSVVAINLVDRDTIEIAILIGYIVLIVGGLIGGLIYGGIVFARVAQKNMIHPDDPIVDSYVPRSANHRFENIAPHLLNDKYTHIIPKEIGKNIHVSGCINPSSIQYIDTVYRAYLTPIHRQDDRSNRGLYMIYDIPKFTKHIGSQTHFKPDQRQSLKYMFLYSIPGLVIGYQIFDRAPFVHNYILQVLEPYIPYPKLINAMLIGLVILVSYYAGRYTAHKFAYSVEDSHLEDIYDVDSHHPHPHIDSHIQIYDLRATKYKCKGYTELYIDGKLGQVTIKYDFLKHNISDQVNTERIKQHIIYQQELLKDLQLV